jgi:hypothetical protein
MIRILVIRESYGPDYYVYQGEKLIRVCPSMDVASAVAASLSSDV